MLRRIVLALALVVALAVAAGWWRARPAPATAYVGGPVLTMDASDRVVGGVGVEAGRIARVGPESDVRIWAALYAWRLPSFDIDEMMAYFQAARAEAVQLIDGFTNEDLGRAPNPDRDPDNTIAKILAHVLIEEAQHVGQIAYIRGLQRGIGK